MIWPRHSRLSWEGSRALAPAAAGSKEDAGGSPVEKLSATRPPTITTLPATSGVEDAHHAKAFALFHTAADHVQVARLEQLQVEGAGVA